MYVIREDIHKVEVRLYKVFFTFFFFGCATWHVGWILHTQRSNHSIAVERVLTPGPPEVLGKVFNAG